MKRKLISSILFLTLILSNITGCTSKNSEKTKSQAIPIRVAYWGSVEEKEIITNTIKEWQISHPDINVILEHIPSGSYTDKILTEIAGGNAPDIIFTEVNIFVTFFYKNALLDLTPFLKKDKEFSIDSFFPEVVARFTRDGKIFCIPRDTAPFACIYYNKSLFKKLNIPLPDDNWDFDTFIKIAKKLTIDENGKHPGESGFNEKKITRFGFWGWTWWNFVYGYGGSLVDDINNPKVCKLDEEPAIQGVQLFYDLSYKYFVSPRPETLTNMGMNINQMFVMEKLAMFQSGIWETPNLRRIIGNNFEWDVAMFPKGPTGKRGFGTGGSGYAILKTTKYPEQAWEVIKCLAGDKGQRLLGISGLAQPANKKISESDAWALNNDPPSNKKMLNRAILYAKYDPFHPRWREAWDKYIAIQIDLIINNRVSVRQGLKTATNKVNQLLQEIGTK